VRSPSGPLDARLSRTVTFDVNFSATVAAVRVLLVAVVHSDANPMTLAGADAAGGRARQSVIALRCVEVV